MPEVQNIGGMDYAAPLQQNNYASEPVAEDNIPMVYDPELEAKKASASNHMGLTLLGVAIAAGLGLWGGHALGSRGKGGMEEVNTAMKDALKEINKESKEFLNKNPIKRAWNNKEFAQSIENKSKKFVEEAEEVAEEVAKEGEKAAKDAAKKAEEAAK